MTNIDVAKMSRPKRREDTACFVHQLLEDERKAKKATALNGLGESAEDRSMDKSNGAGNETPKHSRLLTKKQLSDMTWGVREFSKKLGSLRLRLKVGTVFILTKAHDEDLIGYTRKVVEWLLSRERSTPYIVYVRHESQRLHYGSPLLDTSRTPLSTATTSTPRACYRRTHRMKGA